MLLPFQVSVLGTPSPAVTPTNLLYNIVATPGGLYRYWRQGQTGGKLAPVLIAGTLPGVVAGSVIRVELRPDPRVFDLVVAAALLPLGIWLALTRPSGHGGETRARLLLASVLVPLAAAVGCVGGIYGIGGGSILAPILIGSGREPAEIAPDWPTGIALGIGGLIGAYVGARLQSRLPDALIRRLVGVAVIAIGGRYLWAGLG